MMKVKKVSGIALICTGYMGALPLLLLIVLHVMRARLGYVVILGLGTQRLVVALFVAGIMCMAAGLYLIGHHGRG